MFLIWEIYFERRMARQAASSLWNVLRNKNKIVISPLFTHSPSLHYFFYVYLFSFFWYRKCSQNLSMITIMHDDDDDEGRHNKNKPNECRMNNCCVWWRVSERGKSRQQRCISNVMTTLKQNYKKKRKWSRKRRKKFVVFSFNNSARELHESVSVAVGWWEKKKMLLLYTASLFSPYIHKSECFFSSIQQHYISFL